MVAIVYVSIYVNIMSYITLKTISVSIYMEMCKRLCVNRALQTGSNQPESETAGDH